MGLDDPEGDAARQHCHTRAPPAGRRAALGPVTPWTPSGGRWTTGLGGRLSLFGCGRLCAVSVVVLFAIVSMVVFKIVAVIVVYHDHR